MQKYGKSLLTLGLVIVVAGAGAAVGPILAQRLTVRTTVTATQALHLDLPLVDMAFTPFPTVISGSTPTYKTAQQLPQGARVYESLTDTSTEFTVAADLTATSSKFDVIVPIGNLSNNQVVARLELDIPDGLDVDIERSGPVNVNTLVPAITSIAGKANFTRINPNTWEGTWPPQTATSEAAIEGVFPFTPITAYNGFVMHIALHNGTPPGFYLIQGKVVPRNV